MIEELSGHHAEWNYVTVDQISLQDVSGHGGNRTFKVTRTVDECIIGQVALHLIGELNHFENQPDILNVQTSATLAFATSGLCPKRLLQKSEKFFVDEWLKNSKNLETSVLDVDLVSKMGAVLARVHQIEPKWYDVHYEKLISRYPDLAAVPRGSTFWYLAGGNWPLMSKKEHAGSMDKWLTQLSKKYKEFLELETTPVTEAGQRIVTTHGDFNPGNLIVTDEGVINVIDFEQTHVSFAVEDISYFFGHLPCTSNCPDIKLAFCKAYLKEMGYPHEEEDVFALTLDGERGTLSSGFMSPVISAFIDKETISESYHQELYRQKLFAADALNDKALAHDIIEGGIYHSMPYMCIGNEYDVGALITAAQDCSPGTDFDLSKNRYQFLVNGDGTIMPKNSEKWRGLVLGSNRDGDVILTNHCNTKKRLQLSKDVIKSNLITGYSALKTQPFPLLIKSGNHAGKAIVRSRYTGTWFGNVWYRITVGNADEAANVHFEDDGAIRFADKPEQALNCDDEDTYSSGTRVDSYQYQDCEHQKFVQNLDDTISPRGNLDVILAFQGDYLQLQDKKDIKVENRLVFDFPEHVKHSSSKVNDDNDNKSESLPGPLMSMPLKLELEIPKGKGISFERLEVGPKLKNYLGSKTEEDASKFKVILTNKEDASKAVINAEESLIGILKEENNSILTLHEEPSMQQQLLLRVGCWK